MSQKQKLDQADQGGDNMAIRKMNVDMFDKIANNKSIKEETFELTA